ncbi:hypothetical protein DS901_06740 [Loktanella sp. D2R18]|uniref:Hint domain-containing protein n=1 Tax=Rhodobacterales TaxID=204455 RepID=UPI000DE8E15F|nr:MULTISPECIES: Hint domain-containing protein [Rhodobacterales]MDO6589467.1 Hint domain-containing protein [Yoonia sp. 1_MG-2023]RBW44117.1 hypothetical protein DS901_06740 [Loktanella sp. D2R18]
MALDSGDLLFVGWDADNEDIAFIATTDIAAGEIIYFTDDERDASGFFGSEQLMEWTVPVGGISAGTVVTIDMDPVADTVTFDAGGTVDYITGGYQIATQNEMFWAFQGTRVGDDVTATNYIAVIANEADGTDTQTPNLTGTGLTTSNGALIIDGDEDIMEWTGDASLPDPVQQSDLIDSIMDTNNWTTADGTGNQNPGGGFDIDDQSVVCFALGTRIATPNCTTKIEDFRIGDLVTTASGADTPIQWIGHIHIPADRLAQNPKLRPIRITAGALGHGLPTRDLLVSRQHRLLVSSKISERMFGVSEVLVAAIRLVGIPGIYIDKTVTEITYFHILCTEHVVLFAEGAPAESLLLGEQARVALPAAAVEELTTLFPHQCSADISRAAH